MSNFVEFDRLITEMFNLAFRETNSEEIEKLFDEKLAELQVTDTFREWFKEYLKEELMTEEFKKHRLVCQFCFQRITDEKFIMIEDPTNPEDLSKLLYFHSTGDCNPINAGFRSFKKIWFRVRWLRFKKKWTGVEGENVNDQEDK